MAAIKNLIFFGTPDFALPSLDALDEAGFTPSLVVTQPARPSGRGRDVQDPPVAEWAQEHGVELAQPERVADEGFLEDLAKRKPHLIVVVAFGQIFPAELLELPKRGCINVHASLLPKYRGASPIQGVLMNGEKKTGITIMRMEETLDTGPIVDQVETEIRPWETAEELGPRLSKLGAELLVSVVERWHKGKEIKERKQREESASYSPQISKADGKLNWALRAEEIYNRLRAFTPWPGMKANFRGDPLKVVWGVPVEWEQAPIGVTGTFLGMRQGRIAVLCGDSTILGIEELQRPGKKLVRASDFVNGEHLRIGERFS
jgi:methionyl-tRNA formyltransferase